MDALVGGKDSKINNAEIFEVYSEEWSDYLNIDLKMRPSKIFDKTFEWTSKNGINSSNIGSVIEDFANYRGLAPIRISVIGPPMTGKTSMIKTLKTLLKVRKMNIRDAIEFCKKDA